jgi:hypothetical protein
MDLRAAEKLCRPSLRSESAAAAFSCSQPDGIHGHGRVLRSQHSFSLAICACPAFALRSLRAPCSITITAEIPRSARNDKLPCFTSKQIRVHPRDPRKTDLVSGSNQLPAFALRAVSTCPFGKLRAPSQSSGLRRGRPNTNYQLRGKLAARRDASPYPSNIGL